MHGNIPFYSVRDEAIARRACLSFLIDRDILSPAEAAVILRVEPRVIDALLMTDPVILDVHAVATMDHLMATMSLLLDGYTPDRMAQWFTTPMKALDDATPARVMGATTDGAQRVLAHAEAWMS